MTTVWQKAFVLFAFISIASCVQLDEEQQRAALMTDFDGSLAQMQVNLRQLERRMNQLTEDKQCQQHKECKVLAKGIRPCGGAEQFIAYSVSTTDEDLLLATSDKFNQLRQRQRQRLGSISSCEALVEPVASCQQNTCTLQTQEYARR